MSEELQGGRTASANGVAEPATSWRMTVSEVQNKNSVSDALEMTTPCP